MRRAAIVLGLLLATALVGGWAAFGIQQPEVDRDLEEAKGLYREAKFAQAIAKLQSAIGRLDQLRDLEVRKIQLADAYLHLALSYVALNDSTAARETLKQMVRLDRSRRLDPEVYAPKVIEIFEQARAEVAAEPQKPDAPVSEPPAPQAELKKKRSRLPYILAGAGGGAAAGVLAGASGGKATSAAGSTTPSGTTTTTSTPVSSGPEDIVFLGSDPPPGSTISVGRGGNFLTVRLSLQYSTSGNYSMLVIGNHVGRTAGPVFCVVGSITVSATAGQSQTLSVPVQYTGNACPSLPFEVLTLEARLHAIPDVGRTLLGRDFAVTYRLIP
jgi:hypothetical protein